MPLRAISQDAKVRVLFVEDSAEDAELIQFQLEDAHLNADFLRVEDAAGLRQALQAFRPDIVLSDLSMPGFSGHEALAIVREHSHVIPFIFVSGTIGEDVAVAALREGASDYILKHSSARLPVAVERALREAKIEAERQRVEQELMRSQRLESLSLLAAGLSHDLRNILQPLLIVPDLIAQRSDDPRLHQLASVVAECGRRGHEMAESMLSFVRGSRRASEHFRLADLFHAVQLLLKGSMPRQVQLQVSLSDPELGVEGNYTEMQQCLLNLSLNAIQAMPDGGRLELSADAVDGQVRLRVADTGNGMDPQILAQLFTPFFTTKANGTGLGLVSCRRIVEGMGGRIEVASTPGQGTCFELWLPLPVEEEEAEVQRQAAAVGHGERLLLVFREGARLSLVGNALTSQGYRTELAADGAAALRAWAEAGAPDAVVVDSGISLFPAEALLSTMHESGYAGPAIVIEDPESPFDPALVPASLPLQRLPRPLDMHRLFEAVAAALAGRRAD
ncbi:hybrid sensor histidine kinase/response regulator [Pseudoxanthomonas jiangsuensis]|uniref:sensor histidine kinase n=1 Tax=Pseudoxanthomonas jiangsuensis TaxID=619688 RepID=UPI001391D9F5|nr:ATP-binding protein [Pseudoxanthomonas jiangsuensis]KAF1696760.1 hybrid sensor histidine kinase/response regulator [Pseudoxanthomonas jiangsuensis]